MGKALDSIKEFATIAFTLLGVLFGMVIMAFIFGQLGPSATGLTIDDPAFNTTTNIQNNSLIAIETYSDGASTQFNTLSITIILILLIAVFLIFWRIFVSSKNKDSNRGSGGNFGA